MPVNLQFLRGFRPSPLPPKLTIRNLPSENERNLVLGYVSEKRGEFRETIEYFRRVEGPARARGQIEIARILAATGQEPPAPR